MAAPSADPPAQSLGRMMREIRELAFDHIELITLETRFSVHTLLKMAAVTVVSAIALISALLALLAAAALTLVYIGMSPHWALLLLATANTMLALICWLRVKQMNRRLGWPGTQRTIQPEARSEQAASTP